MFIERWAIPVFKKAGFTPENTHPIARSAIECACCEVCFLFYGLEPRKTELPFGDMYICDFCNKTYHWIGCLKNTGCFTERQREEVDKTDDWACPACADLILKQKQKRSYESSDKEFIKVTWGHTWEPEESNNKWPTFQKHILDFQARKDESDLNVPPADKTMSNLERHSFALKITEKTWKYKLDTQLKNSQL